MDNIKEELNNFGGEEDFVDDEFIRSKKVLSKYWYFCKLCGSFIPGSKKLTCRCWTEDIKKFQIL